MYYQARGIDTRLPRSIARNTTDYNEFKDTLSA